MTYDDALAFLFPRTTTIKFGLATTRALLRELGNPHEVMPSVHIGGTNGKGSTAALVAAALREMGWRVGLYTSPHLISFRERILVDDVPISEAAVAMWTERLRPLMLERHATFFEATTALAFADFAARGAEIAVIEVGLGGRLDSTNVVRPLVSAVTKIERDHLKYLGETLEQIAREKAGIAKPGVPFVIGERDPGLVEVLRREARRAVRRQAARPSARRGAAKGRSRSGAGPAAARSPEAAAASSPGPASSSSPGPASSSSPGPASSSSPEADVRVLPAHYEWAGPLGLDGPHQRRNAGVAHGILMALPAPYRPAAEQITRGFARARIAGRLDRRGRWLFDVAHNPDSMRALVAALTAAPPPGPVHALVSILGDKDWPEMLVALDRVIDRGVLTLAPTAAGRGWDLAWLSQWLGDPSRPPARASWTLVPGFPAALRAVQEGAGTIVVTGSFHTVGDVMEALGMSAG